MSRYCFKENELIIDDLVFSIRRLNVILDGYFKQIIVGSDEILQYLSPEVTDWFPNPIITDIDDCIYYYLPEEELEFGGDYICKMINPPCTYVHRNSILRAMDNGKRIKLSVKEPTKEEKMNQYLQGNII